MTACAVKWCACLIAAGEKHCRAHLRSASLRPGVGIVNDCASCRGTGKCPECDGRGERQCDMGHTHECSECHGRKSCWDCKADPPPELTPRETLYIAFAFDVGPAPLPPIEWPWEEVA